MHQNKFKVISNKKITKDSYKLKILAPELVKFAKPGQFINVRIQDTDKPLLRRPFAVHNIEKTKGVLEILYKIRGLGTRILTSKKKGSMLDIMGPLGNGFDVNDNSKKALVVAGGIGAAPLLFLTSNLAKKRKNIVSFIGADCKDNLLSQAEFKKLGAKTIIATEDGSKGIKGKITDALKNYLLKQDVSKCEIFASGPKAMLKTVAEISQSHNLSAQISLDEIIACGVGACLGCAIMTKDGYKLVCKDGPVFKAGDIIWQ